MTREAPRAEHRRSRAARYAAVFCGTSSAFLLAEWVSLAISAVVRPETLSDRLCGLTFGLRRDTAATLAFALSIAMWGLRTGLGGGSALSVPAAMTFRARRRASADGTAAVATASRSTTVLRTLGGGAMLYGTSGWLYISANSISHPETLRLPLTHLLSWPSEATFGQSAFVVSFLGALTLQFATCAADEGAGRSVPGRGLNA